jgi:hypothetical protein
MDTKECTKYFWEDIRAFTKSCSDFNINCTCKSDIINHITFAFVVLLIVGAISAWVLENKNVFFIFLLLSVLHALFWYSRYEPKVETESFKNVVPPDWIKEEIIGEDVTYPTANNPFMNVLIDEIKYNPTRAPAASGTNPLVNMQLDDFFHTQFVNDPTDVFNTTQSQRQFYTTPSTTVPNDQDSYQNWLYRIPGKTCKEGGREACAAQTGSAGGAIPWLNSSN